MCGIAGFLQRSHLQQSSRDVLDRMGAAIGHRGPDGRGFWTDEEAGVALVHNRLAIIDLTPTGAQPMQSANGRWVIAFNGEIYNYERLRARIDAEPHPPMWQSHSDTEVLLEAIARWGITRALQATIGMFAIAVWDRAERRLTLARDRAGEKPLYYGWSAGVLLFGSELKALRAHPRFSATIDRAAVASYLRFGYVPTPKSIYAGISKLAPGHSISFADKDDGVIEPYWTPPAHRADPSITPEDASSELETLLRDAVGLQMRADVPMGAFLSGGVDSSAIVAIMQSLSARPVKTFSIGFQEAEFNEAKYAAKVARHLGTEHHELTVSAADAMDVVPLLPNIYDEPFADSSQIPTYLLAKLTRRDVTVSLSGDAGDELFGGYTRYFQSQRFDTAWRLTPGWARRGAARALRATPPAVWQAAASLGPRQLSGLLTRDRVPKIANALEAEDIYAVYRRLVSQWKDPLAVTSVAQNEPLGWIDDQGLRDGAPNIVAWMMAVDFRTYLPDDILVKVDRASMAVSLESRVPFLDHRVVEFAARLPLSHNVSGGVGKRVLRDMLYRHVPRAMIERPKQGFGVPLADWLRGPLRDWAEDLLDPARMIADGLIDPAPVRTAWKRHLDGVEDMHYPLWVVLMLQSWLRAEGEERRLAA